ncbi:MAG: hypothetical protein ACK4TN_02990 [Brevinematales bacterium]
MRRLSLVLVICIVGAVSLWSNMLPFSSFSPYIGEENQWCVRFETKAVRFFPFLWLSEAVFLYSPTPEASVDIAVPVWYWQGMDVVFGDITVDFRGVIFRDDFFHWRALLLGGIRLPTGISPMAGMRRVEGKEVSYYPYSTASLGWRGGLMVSYMGWPVWIHGAMVYVSEYGSEENLLDMHVDDDMVMIQTMGDYLFRFSSWRFLVSGGALFWVSWGKSPWGNGIRLWQKSTFFFGQWRVGYEVIFGQEPVVGFLVQYNF